MGMLADEAATPDLVIALVTDSTAADPYLEPAAMTLKDAVDAVTLSLNQYGDGADQAARYANVSVIPEADAKMSVCSVTAASASLLDSNSGLAEPTNL